MAFDASATGEPFPAALGEGAAGFPAALGGGAADFPAPLPGHGAPLRLPGGPAAASHHRSEKLPWQPCA